MSPTSKQLGLVRMLDALDAHRASATVLVTLLVKPGATALAAVAAKLRDEVGMARNIKNSVARKHVQQALRVLQAQLKAESPAVAVNGRALFVGQPDEGEFVSVSLAPPAKIAATSYTCATGFRTDALRAMLAESDKSHGIVVVDGSSLLVAVISGANVDVVHRSAFSLPSKTRRGGSSSARYQRQRV